MGPRTSPRQLEQWLHAAQRDYERIKQQLLEVGFICEGSLVERFMPCGKSNCRCVDPEQRHGQYWQLSWKLDGKTARGDCHPSTQPSIANGSPTAASSTRSSNSFTRFHAASANTCSTPPATTPPQRPAPRPLTSRAVAAPPNPGISPSPAENPGFRTIFKHVQTLKTPSDQALCRRRKVTTP
jgi:hypothetical protein